VAPTPPQRIFHIATRADWEQAKRSGTYTTSTVGRSLAEEGFIHASRRQQVAGVFSRYYRDVAEPLVLLTIAPERLAAEVRDDPVGDTTFPHVYGPIETAAVVDVRPLDKQGGTASVAALFAQEMARRMGLALVVMAASLVGLYVAASVSSSDAAPLAGLVSGLAVGVLATTAWAVLRWRR
jgi:uncharacterized protein (DUF952 family)